MAQITFLATDEDLHAIWRVVLVELRMTAFPDPWFGELPVPALSTPAHVAAQLVDYPRVEPGLGYFLTSPNWSVEPLDHRHCRDNPSFAPHWYVSQRYGGPSIHFIPRFGYPWHKEPHQIIAGTFSDYPYYYSATDQGRIIQRPPGLATSMQAIRQALRANGKIVRAESGERAIALNGALASQEEGTTLRLGNIVFAPVAGRRRTRRCT